jgi:choice-of-anchor C domain-containing protein
MLLTAVLPQSVPHAAGSLVRATSTQSSNLVVNGDFEVPVVAPSNGILLHAGTGFLGWNVISGSVDLTGGGYWQAASGTQSVDLSGTDAGMITQNVPTTPGASYILRFALAGNPDGAPSVKQMSVLWGATTLATLSFNTTGYSRSNMGWTYSTFVVPALSSTTTLGFQSLTPGGYGPVVDNVSLVTETARLAVSPASGSSGASVLLAGAAYQPRETVDIYADSSTGPLLYTALAGANGAFVITRRVPQETYGSHVLMGVGQSSGHLAVTPFAIAPLVLVTPTSGRVGTSLSVNGFGFGANEQVLVSWNNPADVVGTAPANSVGSFYGSATVHFTIPPGTPAGQNVLYAVGQTSHAQSSVVVTVP